LQNLVVGDQSGSPLQEIPGARKVRRRNAEARADAMMGLMELPAMHQAPFAAPVVPAVERGHFDRLQAIRRLAGMR